MAAALLLCAGAVPAMAAGPEVVLDNRGWEMVSPADKNGGEVETLDTPGAGPFQAATQGGRFTFPSAASSDDAIGAPPFSQYLAQRGSGTWGTQNVSPDGVGYDRNPYIAFSADLSRALLLEPCPAAPPCSTEYELREMAGGPPISAPADPGAFAGASPDLRHIVFLKGTDLFRWSPPAAPVRVNDVGAAGLAAPEGAVSADGSRIYWRGELDGNLRLWEGGVSIPIDIAAGGGGAFAGAAEDGSPAFFTKDGDLWRYVVGGGATQVAPRSPVTEDVAAVLAITPDATRLFYLTTNRKLVLLREGAAPSWLAAVPSIDISTSLPAETTTDGLHLFFTSPQSLVGSDTNGAAALDAYQLSLPGASGCTSSFGCLGLLSSGRTGSATFLDASADGTDAYFLTNAELVGADNGPDLDVYDARAGGGFPEASTPIPCIADACQGAPVVPEPLFAGTALFAGRDGNVKPPKKRIVKRCKKTKKKKGKKKRCVKKKKKAKKKGKMRGKRGGRR